MTRALWRSAVIAALFALHPLHVEAVAWVSERKEVLSTLFGLLALRAYIWHAARPAWSRLAVVTLLLAISLLAKPMWVTFPFVLLLLDFWPLRRGQSGLGWTRLALEKIPLFVVIAVFCGTTLYTQIALVPEEIMYQAARVPFHFRLANALVSYVIYLRQTFLPVDLAVFYQHPGPGINLGLVIASGTLLGALSWLAWRVRARAPYVFVGWWWYIGMLVPVIGLVQVGEQARADRYTYVPLIGIFLLMTWAIADLLQRWPAVRWQRWLGGAAAGMVLLGCAFLTFCQAECWQNDLALWKHAVEATTVNPRAVAHYGQTLSDAGQLDEAMNQFNKAIALDPEEAYAYHGRGLMYQKKRQLDEALRDLNEAVRLNPELAEAYNSRGTVLEQQGKLREALDDYEIAIQKSPNSAGAYYNRGNVPPEVRRPAGHSQRF